MSRHYLNITSGSTQAILTLGYDRPLKQVFFQLDFPDDESRFIDNTQASLAQALEPFVGEDAALQEKLSEHLSPIFREVAIEEMANEASELISFRCNALQMGYSEEERDAMLSQAGSFNNFNRVVQYEPLVLNA